MMLRVVRRRMAVGRVPTRRPLLLLLFPPDPFLLLPFLLLLLFLLLLGSGGLLLGLLFGLELLPQLGQVLAEGLRRLLPGLDVANIVPVPVLGVAVEEPPRWVLVAYLLDDGLGDEPLLPLEPCRQVHSLPLLDEVPILGVARVGIDGAAPAAQDVTVGRLARLLGGWDGIERTRGDLVHRHVFLFVRRHDELSCLLMR